MNTKETKKKKTQHGQGKWIVYRHIRLDKNKPFYIGIARDPNRPNNKKDRSAFWKNIINKTEYIVEILFDNLTKDKAIKKEIEFIKLYGRVDLKTGTLCNLTMGGEGTGELNPDLELARREKIKNALTGGKQKASTKINQALGQKHRIPVTIDGVEYISLRKAGIALGIHKATVKSRYL
tara:strand:- start:53 stop:589 length:537 start_codon:yes stop_codon:yes gene_type:complete